ncbi:hypothetical protein A5844_000107 [Enterococcus sp. 10A9_DIV0425]|uniref:Cyclic lactone autoinducer peptide n=1 Tax=Candidatus Enterococcus wittei TaxID=1987383 RepID=A0A2C9XNX0_9ENTE|nr:cyclic lactone autoinducer peptide [Enterococcus sp. 10A9_DIV0425]OTP11893.1 hypothetical protein A5844_000107 [Enterococcus sp. 10A9_DIV0425]THE06687.1 cyclic lactone autoinducer peptide [Enterococcus hirae]
MMTYVNNKKIQMMKLVSTMAMAIATYAVANASGVCLFAIYEPKMPEALKNELNK